MKKLVLPLAVSALLLGSCATQQIAQQGNDDDVYFTEAKAKEITVPVANTQNQNQEKSYRTDEQLYGGGDYSDERYSEDYDYDYGYASRLNRFYGRSPWRTNYYDSWYAYGYNPWYTYHYDPFYYDPWYYSPGTSVWIGIGTFPRYGWYSNHYWGYYGAPYNSRYWGPYSYYNSYPGYYGGGYYSGRGNNANYRTRPNRGGSDVYTPSNRRGTIVTGGQPRTSNTGNNNGRVNSGEARPTPSRRPRPSNPDYTPSRERGNSTSSRENPPARTERPTTVERQAPPPSSSGSGNNNGGNSGGGGSSRTRPSRGGN